MNRIKIVIILLTIFPFLCLTAQDKKEIDFGTSLSFEIQKDITRRITLSGEEELRLITNNIGFDRSMTSLGADYSIISKRLKIGAYYSFIYTYNNDFYYEMRNRLFLSLSYKQPLGDFTLSWRGRFQGTYRDESKGEYKTNPKYILRNKFDLEYTVFGSPWTPYVSVDLLNTTNDPTGNDFYRIRYQAGVNWRLNRTDYMKFFMRFDDNFSSKDPNIVSLGFGYQIKL